MTTLSDSAGEAMRSSFPKPVPVPVRAAALAQAIGGVSQLVGDGDAKVECVSALKDAAVGSLVFCRGTIPGEVSRTIADQPASVIVAEVPVDPGAGRCVVVVADPRGWFIRALHHLFPASAESGIDPLARVSPDCRLGPGVGIGPGTIVAERCSIGGGTRIGAHVVLGPGTRIGRDVLVQDNSVIGCAGLGYHVTAEGERLFFPHLGAAVIGDRVVIGAGCVVVRGMIEDTAIGDETRIGNLVNVGHNVKIGRTCAISSGAVLVGGAQIGDGCNLAAGVTVNANVVLGDGCQVGLGSVVTKSVAAGLSVFGVPAQPVRTMRRF